MALSRVFDWGFQFYADYPMFCYVAGAVLLLLLLWKPAKVLKAAFLVVVLLTLLYLAFFLVDSMKTGVKVKEQGLDRMEKSLQ